MTDDEILKVVRAHKDGKAIQRRDKRYDGEWEDVATPTWDFDSYEYRTKPIPYEDSIRADERRKFAEWIVEYCYVFEPGEDAFTLRGDVHFPSVEEILDEYEEYEECEDEEEE